MIHCIGLNHTTSPAEIREAVALTPEETEKALSRLREEGHKETLILATCNRMEFYARSPEEQPPVEALAAIFRWLKGVDILEHEGLTYVWKTADTVPHFFRVTSGLDSMVIGETEIAGQVRNAADLAARMGASGPVLRRMVDSAVRCSRRVRTETSLTEGSISMASVSVGLAAKVLGALQETRVLIVGAGETCRVAADYLRDAGVKDFTVANRTLERAGVLAQRLGGRAHSLEDLPRLLPEADLVFSATSSPAPLIGEEMVRQAIRARRGRSMVIVDLAMPRDVDPAVNKISNVFVYSTESVKSIVDDNLERRRREAPRAEAIVAEESAKFLDWYRSLAVTPTLADMRSRLESLRHARVEAVAGKFRAEDREKLELLTRSIINDILREPTLRLMQAKDDPRRGPELAGAVRHLFDLEKEPTGPGETDEDRDAR